jgi:hypothetical protein
VEWMRLHPVTSRNASFELNSLAISNMPFRIFGQDQSAEKEALVQLLAKLDACLFQPTGSAAPTFDGNQLWSLLDKALKSQRHLKEQVKGEQERLYPDL